MKRAGLEGPPATDSATARHGRGRPCAQQKHENMCCLHDQSSTDNCITEHGEALHRDRASHQCHQIDRSKTCWTCKALHCEVSVSDTNLPGLTRPATAWTSPVRVFGPILAALNLDTIHASLRFPSGKDPSSIGIDRSLRSKHCGCSQGGTGSTGHAE